MVLQKKQLRYYYWLTLEFFKKNAKLLLLSFFLTIVAVIGIVSLSPYLISITTAQKNIIGVQGDYDLSALPEYILSKISNGLVFINDKGQVVPILAERWEQSDNGKEYKFYLRKNLTWNNGDPFTAHDLKYKFKDVEIIVLNDYEVDFKLKKPLPIFPSYLTQPIIKYPLIGVAGLYKVDRTKQQFGYLSELDLAPNKNNFPVLVYKFYDNDSKLINAYKLGQIREMTITKKSVIDSFRGWKNTTISRSVDYSRLLTLFFNVNGPSLKQKERKELRQAIAMQISKIDLKDLGEPANGPIPPISWAYNQDVRQVSYNEDFVNKMIKTNTSSKINLTLSTYDEYLDIADMIKDSFDGTDVLINENVLSFEKPDSFDLLLAYWKVPIDPDQYYYWHSTQTKGNITGYKSEKVDLLLEQGRNTLSTSERKKVYSTFQKVINDDVPAFFLYYPYIYTVNRK
jgi:peptide/nickel transport system substrate-binding protein